MQEDCIRTEYIIRELTEYNRLTPRSNLVVNCMYQSGPSYINSLFIFIKKWGKGDILVKPLLTTMYDHFHIIFSNCSTLLPTWNQFMNPFLKKVFFPPTPMAYSSLDFFIGAQVLATAKTSGTLPPYGDECRWEECIPRSKSRYLHAVCTGRPQMHPFRLTLSRSRA